MAQLNSGYSSSEVMAMQRDAIERVREMQRRSQEKLQQTTIPAQPPVQPPQPPAITVQTHQPAPRPTLPEPAKSPPAQHANPAPPPIHHHPPHASPPPPPSSPIQSLLGGILGDMDGEKIMLLLLIYLLAKEGADQMLILALLYLVL